MRYSQLTEGMRYGAKQKNEVLSDLESFGFGIEIEMNPPEDAVSSDNLRVSDVDIDELTDYIYDNPSIPVENHDSLSLAAAVSNHLDRQHGMYGLDHGGSVLYASNRLYDILSDMLDTNPTGDMFVREKIHGLAYEMVRHIGQHEGDIQVDKNELEGIVNDVNRYIIENVTPITVAHLLKANFDDLEVRDVGSYDDLFNMVDRLKAVVRTGAKMLSSFPESFFEMNDISDYSEVTDDIIEDITQWYSSVEVRNYVTALNQFRDTLPPDMDASTELANHPDESTFTDDVDLIESIIDLMIDDGKDLEDILDELGFTTIGDDSKMIIRQWLEDEPSIPDYIIEELHHEDLTDYPSVIENATQNLSTYFDVKREADGQLEAILPGRGVSGQDIITAFDDAFKLMHYLSDLGFYTAENSGLHISISYKKGAMEFDPLMFAIVSNTYRAVKGSADHVRQYVENLYVFLEDNIKEIAWDIESRASSDPQIRLGEAIPVFVAQYLDDVNFDRGSYGSAKYKSVNFEHYYTSNGRVELRYFGGEDYENRKKEYFDEMVRAMYALKMSMIDPSTGKGYAYKDYLHTLYRMVNKIFTEKYGAGINEYASVISTIVKAEKASGHDILDNTIGVPDIIRSKLDLIAKKFGEDHQLTKVSREYAERYINWPTFTKKPLFDSDLPKALRAFVLAVRD